jgi:sugar-specific transcriptional regulator TrmB/DNA-binding CsgD family transcriptional regulator
MNARHGSAERTPSGPDNRILTSLGVSPDDELVYRTLLARPGATLSQLAEMTGWDASRLRRRTRSLEKRGMITRVPSRPVRFTPAPPDVAVEVLALQRQEEIERARLAAAGLAEQFRAGLRNGGTSPVQVLRGREAIAQQFFQTQQMTKREVLILDKPPYVVEPVHRQDRIQRDQLRKGVRYRTIYDESALDAPGRLEGIRELADRGEESRVLADVPLKLVIADRNIALVPFVLPTEREILVLRTSALLDSLVDLFELLWQRATPLWLTGDKTAATGSREVLSAEDELLLAFLRAGFTDSAIARRLGVAQRTVERRMRKIMSLLGARTRFQAGLRVAHIGCECQGADASTPHRMNGHGSKINSCPRHE